MLDSAMRIMCGRDGYVEIVNCRLCQKAAPKG